MYNSSKQKVYYRFLSNFKRSFAKFCETSPLMLHFFVDSSTVRIFEDSLVEDEMMDDETSMLLAYPLDYSISIKDNIEVIYKLLLPTYPYLIENRVDYKEYSISERAEDVLYANVDIDEILDAKKQVIESHVYYIDKVYIKQDELTINEVENDKGKIRYGQDGLPIVKKRMIYKSKIPVFTLISKLELLSVEDKRWEFFSNKVTPVKEVKVCH